MADTIILKIDLQDKAAVIAGLEQIDRLADQLRNKTISLKLDGVTKEALALGKAEASTAAEMEKAAVAAQRQSAAQGQANEAMNKGAKSSSLLGDSLGKIALKMSAWQIIGNIISSAIGSVKEAVSTMKEVDTELTNIQKVTNMSTEEIKALGDAAYSTASQYGVAANEYLANVATFSKAGYGDMAQGLGELAIKTQLVGDVSAETASKFLLSVDAAYQMEGSVKQLSSVLDKANAVENNYATSIEKMAEGMPLAASVASMANVSLEETLAALGTITAATQESGTSAARAFRALMLNIIGDTKTEIEDGVTWSAEEIESLNDVLRIYSKEALEAAEATGKVVNPIEAIAGLAQAYKDGALTEAKLVEITSNLGGKLRTNQLMALIQNFDMFKDMLETMGEAAGSADKEVDTMLSSWESKSNILKNSWTEFVQNVAGSEIFKGLLDAGNAVLSGINSLFESGTEKAQKYADTLKAAFEEDFGADSEYEQLINKAEELTAVEERRLEVLKKQREEREKELQAAADAEYQEWQKKYGTGKTVRSLSNYNGDGTYLSQDQVYLRDFKSAIEEINKAYAEGNIGLEQYQESVGSLVAEYGDLVQQLRVFREEGRELSNEQETLIDSFDALTEASINSGDVTLAYGYAMMAQFMAMGMTAQEAAEAAGAALDALGESASNIPEETETTVVADTGESEKQLKDVGLLLDHIDGRVVQAVVDVISNISSVGNIGSVISGTAGNALSGKFASGTESAPGGAALVNEQGPELISAQGLAWIAGGGRPTVTYLPRGATVLTAAETQRALGGLNSMGPIRAYAAGTGAAGNVSAAKGMLASFAATLTAKTSASSNAGAMTPEEIARHNTGNLFADLRSQTAGNTSGATAGGSYGGYSGGGASTPTGPDFAALEDALDETLKNLDLQAELAENEERFLDAMSIYGQAQKQIGELLDKYRAAGYADDSNEILTLANLGYDYAGKQMGTYSDLQESLIDALNNLTSAAKDAADLEEKQLAVDKAREALTNAESQRTVRIFNPVTGQWEWVADAKSVQEAQTRLNDAEAALKEEQLDREIEALKNAGGEELLGMTLSPALRELINSGSEEDKQAFAKALGMVTGGASQLSSTEGQTQFNQQDSHDTIYQFPGGIVIGESTAANMTLKELAAQLSGLAIQ